VLNPKMTSDQGVDILRPTRAGAAPAAETGAAAASSSHPTGCPMCDPSMIVVLAIQITIDGDQIAEVCYTCGRRVRTFSWHGAHGLPSDYLGRRDPLLEPEDPLAFETVFARYPRPVEVKAVPVIDPASPDRYQFPTRYASPATARAILAHLVGLDVPRPIWEAFAAEVIGRVALDEHGEWLITVDAILDWLSAATGDAS
jgi:hypothetical protein